MFTLIVKIMSFAAARSRRESSVAHDLLRPGVRVYGGAESVALVDEVVAECTDDNLYEFMRRFKV